MVELIFAEDNPFDLHLKLHNLHISFLELGIDLFYLLSISLLYASRG